MKKIITIFAMLILLGSVYAITIELNPGEWYNFTCNNTSYNIHAKIVGNVTCPDVNCEFTMEDSDFEDWLNDSHLLTGLWDDYKKMKDRNYDCISWNLTDSYWKKKFGEIEGKASAYDAMMQNISSYDIAITGANTARQDAETNLDNAYIGIGFLALLLIISNWARIQGTIGGVGTTRAEREFDSRVPPAIKKEYPTKKEK